MTQHLMHVLQVFFRAAGLRQRGPCVAWDSGLQGFVGAMRCMGFSHTSGLCGGHALHGTHSHIILELQGVSRWAAAAVWSAPLRKLQDTHPLDNLALARRLHQFAPLPVSWSKLVPTNLRRLTPANDLIYWLV